MGNKNFVYFNHVVPFLVVTKKRVWNAINTFYPADSYYLNLLITTHRKINFPAYKQKKGDNNLRLLTLNQALAYETLGKNFFCFINRVRLLGGSDKGLFD